MTIFSAVLKRLWLNRDSWLVLVLLAMSLGLNVYLVSRHSSQPSSNLTTGTRVPTLVLQGVNRPKTVIDWTSNRKPVAIYVFTPSCIWCKRNLANIKAIADAHLSDYQLVGISLSSEGLEEYLKNNLLSFPIYIKPEETNGRTFVIGTTTPQTLIIGTDGRVRDVWLGAYGPDLQKRIEATLKVQLPGLLMADMMTRPRTP